MKQISILGCGWLGFSLALSLKQEGCFIKGSTTTNSKLLTLEQSGITPYLIVLEPDGVTGNITQFLSGSELLIINVPPGMRSQNENKFSNKLKHLLPYIENSDINKVLFVSSTSVFGDTQGQVNENTQPIPTTFSGKDLLRCEQILMSNSNFITSVIRFGGLLNEKRHPVYCLAGRELLPNAMSPVNLIHQQDCIGLIQSIIQNNFWNKVVHGVYPYHPTKEEYYTKMAMQKKLTPPTFKELEDAANKKVTSIYVGTELPYNFVKNIE